MSDASLQVSWAPIRLDRRALASRLKGNGSGQMREQGARFDVARTVREFGEALGRDGHRMRRDLSEIRQAVAGGHKSITEARALMDFADSLLAATGRGQTIEVSTGAHINERQRAKERLRPKAERYAMLL